MKSVLVIEDNDLVRETFVGMLQRAGYEVTSARDGREGVELYMQNRPDVVLTDIIMPDQDGIETVLALRKVSADIPIIAVSGGGSGAMQFLDAAHKLGANMILCKPVGEKELAAAVAQMAALQVGPIAASK